MKVVGIPSGPSKPTAAAAGGRRPRRMEGTWTCRGLDRVLEHTGRCRTLARIESDSPSTQPREGYTRTLLATVIVLGAVIASDATAQSESDRKHAAKPRDHAAQLRSKPKEQVECERARHEDPTGSFAGYACWAREAFARGSQGNRE